MTTFGELIIKTLETFGFYRIFLPLLLIWTLLYVVLKYAFEKLEITKDFAGPLASLIGFLVAATVVYYSITVTFIRYFVTFVGLFLAFFIVGLAIISFLYPQKKAQDLWENVVKHRAFHGAILIIFILFFLAALSFTLSPSGMTSTPSNQTTTSLGLYYTFLLFQNPGVIGAIFLLIISGIIVWSFSVSTENQGGGGGNK